MNTEYGIRNTEVRMKTRWRLLMSCQAIAILLRTLAHVRSSFHIPYSVFAIHVSAAVAAWAAMVGGPARAPAAERFDGQYFSGEGDVEYLQLLDVARRMFAPDPEFQHLAMLYTPAWNGLVEGPTWGAWWIQNSYGPTYCALPFWEEPFVTFMQNSQDLWFDQMGDGKRKGDRGYVAPDGALCDAAAPGVVYYRQ